MKSPLSPDLTRGEVRWIKCLRSGLRIGDYAAERGRTAHDIRATFLDDRPAKPLALTWPERLRLARFRTGLSLNHVADEIGCSSMTIRQWEEKGDARLILFWKD